MKRSAIRLVFFLTILLSGFATIYLNLQSTDALQPQVTPLFEVQVEEQTERVLPDVEIVKFLIRKVTERL